MARRPGERRLSVDLSPRAMRLAGWVAALLIVLGIAAAVGTLGSRAEIGGVLGGVPSSTPVGAEAAPIAFGTAFDPVTGEVAEASRADRFEAGDRFAYSSRPGIVLPTTILVEVARLGSDGSLGEVVQPPSPQALPSGAEVLAFSVDADALIDAFGAGSFVMRIYAAADGAPIAEGEFALVTPGPSYPPGSAVPLP